MGKQNTQPKCINRLTASYNGLKKFVKIEFSNQKLKYIFDDEGLHKHLRELLVEDVNIDINKLREGDTMDNRAKECLSRKFSKIKGSSCNNFEYTAVPEEPEGVPTEEPAKIAEFTQKHWSKVWSKKETDEELLNKHLKKFKRKFSDLKYRITIDEMEEIIASTPNTSPGPDGVPFIAYRKCHKFAPAIFRDIYNDPASKNPNKTPIHFNKSPLYLLAKKPSIEHPDYGLVYHPKATRPIPVSDTSNRIISAIFRFQLQKVAEEFVSSNQKGFLNNRVIADNPLEMARYLYDSVPPQQRKYLILIDFEAAFSSVSHDYIFKALTHFGLPSNFVQGLAQLFKNITHELALNGRLYKHADVSSGIKQGDPCSPIIFVIILEPLLEALQDINKDLMIKAYCDDIGMVTQNFKHDFPFIAQCLKVHGKISGAKINLGKTLIIAQHGWDPGGMERIKNSSWAKITETPNINFPSHAVYLGVPMGPDITPQVFFQKATAKFFKRIEEWKTLPISHASRITVANVFLTTLFSHLYQFCVIPQETTKQVNNAIVQLANKNRVIAYERLRFIDKVGYSTSSLKDLESLNAAAIIRCIGTEYGGCSEHPAHPNNVCKEAMQRIAQRTKCKFDIIWNEHINSRLPMQPIRSQVNYYRLIENACRKVSDTDKWFEKCKKRFNLQAWDTGNKSDFAHNCKIAHKNHKTEAFTVAKALINAWPTGRRQRWQTKVTAPCPFCMKQEESVEHFFGISGTENMCPCPVVVDAYKNHFGQDFPTTESMFMMDKKYESADINKRVIFTHAIYRSYLHIRHSPNVISNPVETIKSWTEMLEIKHNPRGGLARVDGIAQLTDDIKLVWYRGEFQVIEECRDDKVTISNRFRERQDVKIETLTNHQKFCNDIHIYTDGPFTNDLSSWGVTILGISDKPIDLKGIAIIDEKDKEFIGARIHSNNTGELSAIYHALKCISKTNGNFSKRIKIFSDSKLAIMGIEGGKIKNHKTFFSNIKCLRKNSEGRYPITFTHVYGHTKNRWNDRADQLAEQAIIIFLEVNTTSNINYKITHKRKAEWTTEDFCKRPRGERYVPNNAPMILYLDEAMYEGPMIFHQRKRPRPVFNLDPNKRPRNEYIEMV